MQEKYKNKISQVMSSGMTIEGIVERILQAAEALPRRGKLNQASQWWSPELTEMRLACLVARGRWKKAEG